MKDVVIPRHTDELGRIPVPSEFRRAIGAHTLEDTAVYLSEPGYNGIVTVTLEPKGEKTVIQGEIGYLLLPQVYRYAHGLNNCIVEFWIAEGKLKFRKAVPQCMITGTQDNLIRYRDTDKYISREAILELHGLL